ncbi:MAG: tRNA (adenosine(37)-N6)-threonylcarbamoyltransferase complex ATPase subunit type 1 TsaE [Parcubacteria group bacterium]|nr:tRNA (adenosine(37)-N6)-threonylcarbamoyltransferase complex ATPase subunit type 1 TsaE [Parcubacteria group bacterium]
MNYTYRTFKDEETKALARGLAATLRPGSVIALTGELGSGKTTFVQGFAQGLGVQSTVNSPTFVLIKRYPIPGKSSSFFFHLDCYRVRNPQAMVDIGALEIIHDPRAFVAIEWAEKIKAQLPSHTIWVQFYDEGEGRRTIEIAIPDPNDTN